MKTNTALSTHQSNLLCEFHALHPYRYLELEDWSWRYVSTGHGTRTLLLLPGAFVGAEMWFHLITVLQGQYRILAPDMPSKLLSLAETNAAVLRLLEVEGTQRAIILGYSAGGGLAQAFAQSHPEYVEHMILSHCTPLSADAAQRIDRITGLLKLLPLPLIRAMLRRRTSRYPSNSEWAQFTRAFFAERITTLDKAMLLRFLESGAKAAQDFRFESQALQKWHGRILILSSRDDTTTHPRLDEMRARYPTAQTHVFEQGGHHTVLLFPEAYNSVIVHFLENLP